jgi:broad specificity phosphatase PhoE
LVLLLTSANPVHSVPLFGRPFYFLRHGESESNRLKIVAGSIDVELTDTGRAQAREAIEVLRPLGVTHVVSSNLRRARETAAIVSRALALPHVVLPDLAERNWGELEGKPLASRVRGLPPPAGAETAEEFVARVRGALAQVRAEGVPLVIAHSGTHRVLCRLLGLPESADAIANCRPVRFTPPAQAGGAWSLEVM